MYEDSRKEYEKVLEEGNHLKAQQAQRLMQAASASLGELIVFNQNGFTASDYVCVEAPEMLLLELERTWDGKGILYVKDVPSLGYKTISEIEMPSKGFLKAAADRVETKDLRVVLNEAGQFTSIYDKKQDRELLPIDRYANRLVTYKDRPHNYDAWDINNYYTLKNGH
ncbi:glycoside hydrolase family 38 C-terminal domain-containing protein [Parablautia intestinalis]|uniref:glycoside hydrolase family 38 C-terminal domain-containing protein n=1 Tax=Parablautia intestinalis TaxID=2320100 RepID=UPI00259CEF6B|nr:glycoside hydrolase family 38 C-terminal domain-containing protein [Parablautia intestinalis]